MVNDLFIKGLELAGIGLAGVFAVLCLFYVSIKLLQKFSAKDEKDR